MRDRGTQRDSLARAARLLLALYQQLPSTGSSSRPASRIALLVQTRFERGDAVEHGLEIRRVAKDHAPHGPIVDAKLLDHRVMRGERERPERSTREIEVRSIEEHPGMRDTVLAERRLSDGGGADWPLGELVEVIIVTGHALAAPTQLASLVEPTSQPMEDDDLVPERAFGIDRSHGRDGQVEHWQIIIDIGLDRYFAVRI